MRGSHILSKLSEEFSPTLREVTINWLADVLNNDLKVLHLDNAIITNQDLAQEILIKKFGVNKGTRLYGYLITRQSKTREQLVACGAKPRTIQDWDKALHDAGVALTMTEKVSLQPLSIDKKAQKNCIGLQ